MRKISANGLIPRLEGCLFMLMMPMLVNAQFTQGPNDPSSGQNTSCPFSYSSPTNYLPVANAFASDNAYATASHCDCCDMNTRCFQTEGFGFTIPLTAVIDGIRVEVEKKTSSNSTVNDNGVKLLKAGNVVGTDHALSANWPYSDAYSVYGSATDLWGTTWLPADINASNFGLAFASISYTCFGNGVPVVSSIDHVRITIYYTDITTGFSNSLSQNAGQLTVSPNPSDNGNVGIGLPISANEIFFSVMDVTGKVLFQNTSEFNGNNFELKMPEWMSKGIYFIQVSGMSNENAPFIFRDKLMVQ